MNRSISDVSWFEFGRQLEYKSAWNSKHFCKVDQYFASTQICSECGNKAHLSLKDRVYLCSNCKAVLDRDYNAALNLQREGIRILKEGCELEDNNNTVATTGINACGLVSVETRLNQEKRGFQQPLLAVA
jgi:putative transposase